MNAPHNPDVEAQRQGWCVMREFRDDAGCLTRRLWLVGINTWQRDRTKALVFGLFIDAKDKAAKNPGSVVTTVPRFNGYVVEWTEMTEGT